MSAIKAVDEGSQAELLTFTVKCVQVRSARVKKEGLKAPQLDGITRLANY